MKKTLIIFQLLLIGLQSLAQRSPVVIGCKPIQNGKLVVQLKFVIDGKIISEHSVNIFRKSTEENDWKKVTTTPFSRASLTDSNTDDDYRSYIDFMQRKPSSNPKNEKNAIGFFGLMMIDNNNLSRYAGSYYEDSNAAIGNTYTYKITDAAANDRELAVSMPFKVIQKYLPLVSGLSAVQKKQNVQLYWKRDEVFFTYNVYRKKNTGDKATKLNPNGILLSKDTSKTSLAFADSTLQPGDVAYYTVTGVDLMGNESQQSDQTRIEFKDLSLPEPIKNLTSKKENDNVILTWQSSAGKKMKGYNVYRSSTSDTLLKKINSALLVPNTVSYTDRDLKEGNVYTYKIESVNETGNSTMSAYTKAFFPDKTPPAKPVGLKASVKPGIVQLTWAKNTETDLKGYYIFRANHRKKEYVSMLFKDPFVENAYIDTLPGVAKNEFIYYIQAVDQNYNVSEPSDTIVVKLPDTLAPHAPTIKNISYAQNSVSMAWYATDDDIDGFDVYRNEDSVNSKTYKKINQQALKDKTFKDSITLKGKSYNYYVIAYDKAGNRSGRSGVRTIWVETDTIAKVPVTDIKANFDSRDTAVTLFWNPTTKNVAGYAVLRKTNDDKDYTFLSRMLHDQKFMDRTITTGRTYKYVIRSFFSDNGKYADSPETNIQIP